MSRLNLPSPQRTVRRGVGVCRRMGLDDQQALQMIMHAAAHAGNDILAQGGYDVSWLAAVHDEAQCQLRALRQARR